MKYPNIGGWHPNEKLRKWPVGSIFENEGKKLYELIIEHKPKLVVEVGAYHGCSTTWIATALKKNKKGKLITIDNGTFSGDLWGLVPEKVKDVIEFRNEDCFETEVPENIDFLFEDGMHSPGFTQSVLERFPAKIVVCHDYMHHSDAGHNVRAGFNNVFGTYDELFFEDPSDCGLAIKYL